MHDTSSPSLTCDQAEASAMLTDEPSRAGQQPDQHCSKNCPTNWSGGRPVGGLELGLDQRDLQVAGQTLTGLHQDALVFQANSGRARGATRFIQGWVVRTSHR